ncbi:beta-ketoacyl-ACP reductase [Candidatus Fermentibacterales bacterium]|nr:beta-ketoacyl-ACP reductase [Candidatus Fermentibacterales bacterium]
MNDSRVAVVTGSARGIGLAVSRRLLQDGWVVAGCDLLEAELEERASELGQDFHPYAVDVGDPDSVSGACEAIEAELGVPTGLVNNAGITRDGLLVRMDPADWEAVLRVNLTGSFLMTRALARGMMRARSGSIVYVSSVVALTGSAGQANYSSSKAGLLGLTRTLARELGSRNIRVNAIAPGFIETDMTKDLPEEVRAGYAARIALGRMGQPGDAAALVAFLLSDGACYISGAVIPLDGGLTT